MKPLSATNHVEDFRVQHDRFDRVRSIRRDLPNRDVPGAEYLGLGVLSALEYAGSPADDQRVHRHQPFDSQLLARRDLDGDGAICGHQTGSVVLVEVVELAGPREVKAIPCGDHQTVSEDRDVVGVRCACLQVSARSDRCPCPARRFEPRRVDHVPTYRHALKAGLGRVGVGWRIDGSGEMTVPDVPELDFPPGVRRTVDGPEFVNRFSLERNAFCHRDQGAVVAILVVEDAPIGNRQAGGPLLHGRHFDVVGIENDPVTILPGERPDRRPEVTIHVRRERGRPWNGPDYTASRAFDLRVRLWLVILEWWRVVVLCERSRRLVTSGPIDHGRFRESIPARHDLAAA